MATELWYQSTIYKLYCNKLVIPPFSLPVTFSAMSEENEKVAFEKKAMLLDVSFQKSLNVTYLSTSVLKLG